MKYAYPPLSSRSPVDGWLVGRSVCRSVGRLVCQSVGLSVCRSVGLSVCRSVRLSVVPPLYKKVCLPPKAKNLRGLRPLGFLALGLALDVALGTPLENPLGDLQSSP